MIDIKKSLGLLVVFISSAFLFLGCSESSSSHTKSTLYIESVVYDDNRTDAVSDDSLSIYFNQSIDFALIENNISANFDINGTGAIGDLISADYSDTLLHRLKITLGTDATPFVPEMTKIALSQDSVMKDTFTLDHSQIVITAFRTVPNEGENTYTVDGNGTVTDEVSGLVIEQEDDDVQRNWNDANTYCSDLNTSGLSWRLPTIDELIALVDRNSSNPAISSEFTNTNNNQYWSSSDYLATVEDDAWSVRFSDGITNDPDKNSSLYVRCVHSSSDTNDTVDYVRDDLKEIVLDTSTNLMWQDTAQSIGSANQKTWDAAVQQCIDLNLTGENDWRLPSLSELDSITDKSRYAPAINPEFQNVESSHFWSSTEKFGDTSEAWYTYFYCGCNDIKLKTTLSNVRCVRTVD